MKEVIITCDGCGIVVEKPLRNIDTPQLIVISYGDANHEGREDWPIDSGGEKIFCSTKCFKEFDLDAWLQELNETAEGDNGQ